jgi:2-iminobutanoate/2-iminopropanoate deaminase
VEKKIFQSKTLPSTKAPYSQAIIYESMLFVSGQVAFDPDKKSVMKGKIEDETELALNNLKTILEEAGSSLAKVLKVTAFLTDMY